MNWLGPLCALGSSVTWAIGSTGYAQLTGRYSAFSVNLARAMVALPAFFVLVFIFSGGWSGTAEQFATIQMTHIGWFSLSMIASYGLGDSFFLWSTQQLGIPAALAIASSYPLWTALAGVLIQGEHLSGAQGAGLVTIVLGMVIVILQGSGGRQATRKNLALGVMLAFFASLCWGLNSFAVANGTRGISAFTSNIIRMCLALLICSALQLSVFPRSKLLLPAKDLKPWLWLFVVEAVGGSFFFAYGLAHSSLAVGATLSSLAPVISVPIAWATGLEKFSIYRTMGIILVVIGICLLVGTGSMV